MFDSSWFSSCLRLHLPPINPKSPCPAEAPDCQCFLDYLLPRTFYHRSTPEARHDLEVFIGNVRLVSIGCFPLPFQPSFFPPHSTAILNSKGKDKHQTKGSNKTYLHCKLNTRSGYPERLVTTGLVQDGKYDRDGGEGKASGPEPGAVEQGQGCGDDKSAVAGPSMGQLQTESPPPCTLHAAPTHEGCQWGQEHLTAKGCRQLSTEGNAS